MSNTLNFNSPKRLCRWAERDIAKFRDIEDRFINGNCYKIEAKDAVLNKQLLWKSFNAVITKQPAEDDCEPAYSIIRNLRDALDHTTAAASKIIAKEPKGKTNFPFGDTEAYVKSQLASPKGPWRGIPTQLHECLLNFEPFGSKEDGGHGNLWLYSLNKIGNPNKHEITIEPQFLVQGVGINTLTGLDIEMAVRKISDGKYHLLKAYPNGRGKAEISLEAKPRLFILDGGPLSQQPAFETFERLHSLVEDIIAQVESETTRIIS